MATEEGRRAYEDILSVIAGLDDKEEIRKLFDDLFTDAEVADFVLRWLLMDDLKRGRSQSSRADQLCFFAAHHIVVIVMRDA